MPATGLKIVGTGACLPWCSISSSFQHRLKTSGHRGYECLEFWHSNLVPFLLDIDFQLLKSWWSSLNSFRLMMCQMFSTGERSGLQASQFSTPDSSTTSHAVVIAAVCGFALSCWNTHCLEGSICCSKHFHIPFSIHSALQNMQAAHYVCNYAPHTIRDAGFWNERWWHAGRSPSFLARRNWNWTSVNASGCWHHIC